MIKVIKLNRGRLLLGLLVFLGLAFCVAGFGGAAQKLLGNKEKQAAPAAVTIIGEEQEITGAEQESGSSSGGGVPVGEQMQGETDGELEAVAYFVEYRMDREQARGKEVELLREVMASPSVDEETRKSAHEKFLRISENISKEMELENLIRARGFRDAAVFLDSDNVTVVVQPDKNSLEQSDSSIITELVAKSAGVSEDDVIVITKDF